jgi:hypothetical protein
VSRRPGQWVDDLFEAVGRAYVRLETVDGSRREGLVSGLRTRTIDIDGEREEIPTEIELNGDALDMIAFDGVRTMSLELPQTTEQESEE